MQCMVGAMSAGATATGTRSWLASRHYSWLTPARLRLLTLVLLGAALVASALLVSGSTPHAVTAAAAARH
jgi:hypothetical protein